MNKTPTTKASPRMITTIGAGVVLVLTMAVVIVSVGFVVVEWQGWMTATSYTTAVAPAALTTTGAMIVALVLYHRWSRDHHQREGLETSRQEHADKLERDRITHSEKLERQRAGEEYFRHRAQERGKRRESMGQRMITAVEHISSTNGMTQSAGLLELGGLVDDWWAFGQEWLNDIDDRDNESVERISAEVQRRRQELIDLIFKQRVPSVDAEDTDAERNRWTMVQETRARLLLNHDSNAHDSWKGLNLSHVYLKGCDLTRADLRGFSLDRANFKGATMHESNLGGVSLTQADFDGAHLERAVFDGADMSGADLRDASFLATSFVGAILERAKFHDVHLYADLRRSILFGVNFRKVEIAYVQLQGARLVNNEDPLRSRITKARIADHYEGLVEYDSATVFPEGFDPQGAGFELVEATDQNHP